MKTYKLKINSKEYTVDIETLSDGTAEVKCNGVEYTVEFETPKKESKTPTISRKTAVPVDSGKKTYSPAESASANVVKAPIPGLITEILVAEGDMIKSGQIVAKMEAMKMENNILASSDGKITSIPIKVGDSVLEGAILMNMENV